VNPVHLVAGTWQSNMDDKIARGRQLRGESMTQSKLTEDVVLWIRASKLPDKVVAEWAGVDASNVSYIRNRKTWQHV
jgi:predicted XRE-type DNA-binding protein